MTTNALTAEALDIWRGERHLCRDLSFRVETGQAVRLHGANGAGKTSLIRILIGLALPESGTVNWNGRSVGEVRDEYHQELAYLGHANGLKSNLSPTENLTAHAAMMGAEPAIPIPDALARMGISSMAHRACGSLSMGQQRRTALARLLLSRASLWILDEPLTSLDVAGGRLLAELIESHLARGMVIFATHQPLELSSHEVETVMLDSSK